MMSADFNSVLLKALNKSVQNKYSVLDTINLITDYLDIAGIPIPGAPPAAYEPIQLVYQAPQPEPQTITTGGSLPKGTTVTTSWGADTTTKPHLLTNLSIQSPIDLQVKTLDEVHSEVKSMVPATISVVIPGFESSPPRRYMTEVAKLNNDPHVAGTVRIRFVLESDRSECESQVVYYATDFIDVQQDLRDFEELVKNKYRNRDGKISTSFQQITAVPSMFTSANSMELGHFK